MTVSSMRAPDFFSRYAASAPLNRVLIGITQAPMRWTAWEAMTHSQMFGAQMATRSPASISVGEQRSAGLDHLVPQLGEGEADVAVDERLVVGEALGRPIEDARDRQRQVVGWPLVLGEVGLVGGRVRVVDASVTGSPLVSNGI